MPNDEVQIQVASRVGGVQDEIGGIGAGRASTARGDVLEPGVQDLRRAGVERGKGTDDTGPGCSHHEIRSTHQEHRGDNNGYSKGLQGGGARHER